MSDAITPKVKAVENMVQRARGATRDPRSPACPVCHIPMWISLFFDGTGNHRDKDFPVKHSNVAALLDAHINEPDNGIIPLYYEGLGRQFSFKERYEEVKVHTRNGLTTVKREGHEESDDRVMGLAFADGISARLEKAIFDVTDQIQRVRGMQRVDEINIAAFGFSRGATEARAFVHWLAAHSKVKVQGAKLSFDGIPLNIKFLGIFDTVESVGWAGANEMPDVIKTTVPPFVQKCCHIVAAHELRHAFPLTVVEGNHRCVVYPGAHANVGGGYAPNEQGRSNSLARVALLQMLDEARGAGLKMMSLSEMQASDDWKKIHKPSFDIPLETVSSLNNYLASVNPSGTLPQHFEAHMKPYWAWIDSGLAMQDIQSKKAAFSNDAQRKDEFRRMEFILRYEARTSQGRGQNDTPFDEPISFKASTKVSPPAEPVASFFKTYVHDSFEHFSMTGGTLQKDFSDANYYHLRETRQPAG